MGVMDGTYRKFMKDNLNLDTDHSRKKNKSHKLLNKVPEMEVENRLNIQ